MQRKIQTGNCFVDHSTKTLKMKCKRTLPKVTAATRII